MKSVEVLKIIATELHLPTDAHLNEVLAYIYIFDKSGEIMQALRQVMTQDIIKKILEDINQ